MPSDVTKHVVYIRIDRIARTVQDGETIKELLAEGINFRGLDSGEVLTGANGSMMLNLQLTFAQYEQELLAEKIENKYIDRRKSRSPMNRPPFGYVLKKTTSDDGVRFRYEPDGKKYKQAQQIYKAFIDNEGNLNGTLNECNFKGMPRSQRGLKTWITNIVNIGHTQYHETTTRTGKKIEHQIIKNTHQPIVDEETFNKAKLLLQNRSWTKKEPRDRPPHPLSGVLKCPACGRMVSFSSQLHVCKGSGLGRYAGQYEKGTRRIKYTQSCRYTTQGRCDFDTTTKALGNDSVNQLKNLAWQYLVNRADQLSQVKTLENSGISKEEMELTAQIKQMEAMNNDYMQTAINEMKKQLEQLRFKQEGNKGAIASNVQEIQKYDLSVEAFNELDYREQNLLIRKFFAELRPAYKSTPAVIRSVLDD